MRIIRFRFRAVMHRAFVIKVVNGSGTYFIFYYILLYFDSTYYSVCLCHNAYVPVKGTAAALHYPQHCVSYC